MKEKAERQVRSDRTKNFAGRGRDTIFRGRVHEKIDPEYLQGRPFKVLLDPIVTNRFLSRCATWYVLKSTTEQLLARFPGMKVYAIVPEEGSWCEANALFDEEKWKGRVIHIPMEVFRDRYKEYYYLKRSWIDNFAYWGDYWDWDICLTTRTTGVGQMRVFSSKGARKKIVIFEPLPLVSYKKTVRMFATLDEMHMYTFTGYMNADLVVINTKHEIDGIMGDARRFLAPAAAKNMRDRMVCKFSSPTVDSMFPFEQKPKWKSGDGPLLVLFPQRLDKFERRPDEVFKAFKYAFVTSGDRFQFEITTNSNWTKEDTLDGFIKFGRPNREEFYEKLRKAQVCCSWALEEGLPLGLYEAACFGVICIVKREPWSEDMYGPDYPWIVDNTHEAVGHLKWIEANYEKAYARYLQWYQDWWLPFIEKRGDFTDFLEERIRDDFLVYRENFTARGDLHSERLSVLVSEFCREKGIKEMRLGEICMELHKRGKTSVPFRLNLRRNEFDVPLSRGVALYETRLELLNRLGWSEAAEPGVFVREDW